MKFSFKYLITIIALIGAPLAYPQTENFSATEATTTDSNTSNEQILKSLENQIIDLEKKVISFGKEPQTPSVNEPVIDIERFQSELNNNSLSDEEVKKNRDAINDYLNELNNKIARVEALAETEAARVNVIPESIAIAKKQLDDNKSSTIDSATAIEQQIAAARINLATIQIEKLSAEQEFFTVKSELNIGYLSELQKRLTAATEIATEWDRKYTSLESENFKRIAGELELIKNPDKLPVNLASIFKDTKSLLETQLTGDSVAAELKAIKNEIIQLKNVKATLDSQEKFATQRIKLLEDANLSIDIKTGHLLRLQRANLPSARTITARLKTSTTESTDNELSIIDHQNTLNSLPNETEDLGQFYNQKDTSSTLFTEEQLRSITNNLVSVNSSLLNTRKELKTNYEELQRLLKSTASAAEKYSNTLDEKLLWIASHQPINLSDVSNEAKSFKDLTFNTIPCVWFPNAYQNILQKPLYWLLSVLVIVVSILLSFKFKKKALVEHSAATSRTLTSVKPTLLGLTYEFLRVLPYPFLIYIISRLTSEPLHIRLALQATATTLFLGLIIKNLSDKDGFLSSNFKVTPPNLSIIRKTGIIVSFIATPIIFVNEALNPSYSQIKEGRLTFLILLILMSGVLFYVLRPKSGLLKKADKKFLKTVFFFIAFGFPLVLAASSLIGYHHSAITLLEQFKYSIRALIIIIFILFVCRHLLLISKRRLAKATIVNKDSEDDEFSDTTLTIQERIKLKLENISEINTQTEKLIDIGAFISIIISLWVIWSSTLPALQVLDEIPIGLGETTVENINSTDSSEITDSSASSNSEILGVASVNSSGAEVNASAPSTFVSIQDVLISLIVAIATYLLAINLPGLLEILVLNRLRLKPGSAFAIKTALRYMIIIIGISWSFSSIGITWGKVQWLAAAISLGIGFGLQEIFANFVAGIILLFERPIRIGDLVTVGGINGRVSKIQIRATTILQFNNRELIVPNKEFITGQLQNWTLSDSMVRAEIPVGIAYGSDTQLAKDLLYNIANDHPLTLSDPEPKVLFTAFGASSLDFILRFHLPTADDLVPVQSEIHFAIDDAFRQADIEMPFPQQDIHIRSSEAPLNIISQQKPVKT